MIDITFGLAHSADVVQTRTAYVPSAIELQITAENLLIAEVTSSAVESVVNSTALTAGVSAPKVRGVLREDKILARLS